jgi:hypothetical protein
MVVEKINKIVGKEIIRKVDDQTISYRELLYPYFENHFYYKLGINIIFGAKTDQKAVKLFLPVELMHTLNQAKIDGKPIVNKTKTIVKGAELESEFSFVNSIYFISLLLTLLVLSNKKPIFLSYLFLSGLLGLFLSLVGLYSLHKEVLWNYNALLFNPLFLIVPFLKNNAFRKTLIVSAACIGVYVIVMVTKPHFLLMLPFIVTNAYMVLRLLLKSKKESV